MDFYKSFIKIEHSYPLTDFQNSRIMEIHHTNDDSWCDLWIDDLQKYLIELWNTTIHWAVTIMTIYTISDIPHNFIKQIGYSIFESLDFFTSI